MIPNLFWPFVNLLILLGVLGYYLRKPLKDFVSGRHQSLRDQIRGASERLNSAKSVGIEVETQLGRFDQEVAEMRSQSTLDLRDAKSKSLAQAKTMAEQIKKDAQVAGADLEARVKAQLVEAVGLEVIDRAGRMVSSTLTSDQRKKLRQQFAKEVETSV
jgi:F0F1-type ATP synthase membrane subunit b/b'